MNPRSRSLASFLLSLCIPIPLAACSNSAPTDQATATGAAALKTGATAVAELHSVSIAVYDLQIHGTFPVCGDDTPEIAELHLVHPRKSGPGSLAIVVRGDRDLDDCPNVSQRDATFRVRLDATSSMAADPEAIHQVSPRIDSDYDVVVDGKKLGVLSVGLPYIMTLDE
jgi:hypothetical protein